MQGYIKLHRSILDNTIFKCKPFSKGQAWITLLLLTNHKEGYINVKNGELIKIERGECGYSVLALADLFGWSRGKVKRFLELLKSEKMIHQKTIANRTIISIINYDNYQNDTVNSTVNSTVNGHLTVHQTGINNNDKNDNNEKNDNKFINDKIISIKKTDPYINPTKKYFTDKAKEILGFKPYLDASMCNKLIELSAEIDDFQETIPIVLEKIKNKKWKFADGSKDVTVNWLLKDSNYTSVLNGAFDFETREEIVARLEKAELERRRKYADSNSN